MLHFEKYQETQQQNGPSCWQISAFRVMGWFVSTICYTVWRALHCFSTLLHYKRIMSFISRKWSSTLNKTYSWWFYHWQQFTKTFLIWCLQSINITQKALERNWSSFLTIQGNMPLNVIELSAAGVLNDEKIICPIRWKWKLNKRFSWLVTKVPIRILFISNTKTCNSRNLRRQTPKAAHYRIASLVDAIKRKRINHTRKSINFMVNSHLQKWNKTKR